MTDGKAGTDGTPGPTEAAQGSPRLEDALALAARLADTADGSVEAVILYGSHILGANPDRHSALDFVVVVEDYRRFYAAMHEAGELHRPVWLMSGLASVLAPNVVAYAPDQGGDGLAKCLVTSRAHFTLAMGPLPPDHFLVGRLVQKVAVVWAADENRRDWVERHLGAGREGSLVWVGPWLEGSFDAETVGMKLLEVSYRGEFRPEARNRAEVVFRLQRDHFRDTLGPVLERAVQAGTVTPAAEGRFRFATSPAPAERRRLRSYFRRSKVRATARWLKHVITFDNWLPYIAGRSSAAPVSRWS